VAASTAARNSGSVNVTTSSGLCGEETPPPAVSLIWLAPRISCSRTRTRSSSGVSAMALSPITSWRDPGWPTVRGRSDASRKSPWPLVTVIIAPDGQMRGPSACPASMAAFSPHTAPPTSRTVVNPRSRVLRDSAPATMLM